MNFIKIKIYHFYLIFESDGFISLPYLLSMAKPTNTKMQPIHWMNDIGLAKRKTEASMVKNFLVVVMIEQVRGPNEVMVVNMKCYIRI